MRFGFDDRVDHRACVFRDLLRRERSFADRHVHIAGLVDLELNASGFYFLDRPGRVVGHRAGLRVRHEAARTEHFAQLSDLAHGFGRRNGHVEIRPAFVALLDQILVPDMLGASRPGGIGRAARLCEHEHFHRLAAAVRQRNRTAHHLIGLLRVNAQSKRQLNRLVEFGFRKPGQHFNR